MSNPNSDVELSKLVIELLNGSITNDRFVRLDRLLAEDDNALDIYLSLLGNHSILRRQQFSVMDLVSADAASDPESTTMFIEELAEYEKNGKAVEVEKVAEKAEPVLTDEERERRIRAFIAEEKAMEAEERRLAEQERKKILECELRRRQRAQRAHSVVRKVRRYTTIGAMAAMLMVIGYLVYAVMHPAPPVFVATLSGGIDVKWADSEQPLGPDSPLRPGNMKLEEGYAQITFNEGARIVIEAPAEINLENSNRAFLHLGKLSAEVPVQARGFKINTPNASITDLGTEFGVRVAEDGTSDIYVLKGKVSLLAGKVGERVGKLFDAVEQIVEAGQAKRVKTGSSRIENIQFEQKKFIRDMPSPYELAILKANPAVYWRFNQDSQSIDGLQYLGNARIEKIGPDLGDGKPNNALKISQSSSYIMAEDVLEDNLHEAYSIVMWIRPEGIQEQNILSVKEDISDPPNDYSHLLVIKEGRFLYVAGLEQESGDYKEEFIECFSSTKLQARRWYHVAVTVERGDLARIFINGSEDGRTAVPGGFSGEWGIIYINPPDEDDEIDGKVPSFRGAIDEIAVFRKALSPDEVRRMYSSVQQ